jgi:hypothetical protein
MEFFLRASVLLLSVVPFSFTNSTYSRKFFGIFSSGVATKWWDLDVFHSLTLPLQYSLDGVAVARDMFSGIGSSRLRSAMSLVTLVR